MGLFGPPNVEKLKAKEDVKGLIKALSYQKDVNVRKPAAQALGQLGDPHAIEPLIGALKDEMVRESAAYALSNLLRHYFKEKIWREAAAKALSKLSDPRAVEPLIAAIEDDWVRAIVLGQLGDARAVKPLIAALEDKHGNVRLAAAQALEKIADQESNKAFKDFTMSSTMMLDRWTRNRKHSEKGADLQEWHYQGCKLMATFDAETGQACALEVQFKNATASQNLANEALAAWQSDLGGNFLVFSQSILQLGWKTRSQPYILMAKEFPEHNINICCNLFRGWS